MRLVILPHTWQRYGLALLFSALATLVTLLLGPLVERTPTPLFFVSVLLSAWYGGLGPGILASLVSTLAIHYFFLSPNNALPVAVVNDLVPLVVFVLVAALVSWLTDARKQAEAAARQERERLRVTLASIGDGVIAADTQERVTFMNGVAETLTGWKQAEAAGRLVEEVFQIVNEQTRATVENPITRVLREGMIAGLANHTLLVTKDGREISIDDSGAPIRDPQGELIGVVLVFRDITERRQAENALRESEEHFRTLANTAPIIVWTAAPDGAITFANDQWFRYCGLTPQQNVREWPQLVLHPDDQERCLAAWTHALQNGTDYEVEVRNRRYDGEYRWFITRATSARDDQGRVTRWFGTTTDIHDRKQAELGQRLLAEAGQVLASSLDYQERLTNVTRLAVPGLADWSAVDVLDEKEEIRRVSVFHIDPAKVELAHELQRRYPVDPNAPTGVPQVLRTGQAEFYPEITDAMLVASIQDPEQLQLARDLGLNSAMTVPLMARGRILGALTLVMAESGRHYSQTDLELAKELAHRIALALDNARLYAETQTLNARLEDRILERTQQLRTTVNDLRREISERQQAEEALHHSREQLRRLSARLQAAREEERTRMAREIHDQLGGAMTGLKMDVAALRRGLQAALLEKTEAISELIDDTIQTVRRIATELRPAILDDFGLLAAIEWQLQEFQTRAGIQCNLRAEVGDISLDSESSTAVFRVFQETLTNVARHANATQVEVQVEEQEGQLILQVHDNGRGISEEEISGSKSLGLVGMQERIHLLSGELDIRGVPEQGTTVLVRIPLGKVKPDSELSGEEERAQ